MTKSVKVMTSKQAQLDALEYEIVSSAVCAELAQQASQLVIGEGNLNAEVIFVGEAPGRNEDLQGRPFVGASGKVLDELLNGIGLKREDIYITNIVKYRPPNNRDPLPQEIAEFMPYLISQIEIISPSIIVPLGKHATNCFLPGVAMSEAHGQIYEGKYLNSSPEILGLIEKGIVIIPQYHPAAIIYNRQLNAVVVEDFKTLEKQLLTN